MADATNPTNPTALRRLGGLELYSSTRHHLGIYRSVVVTFQYQTPPNTNLEPAVIAALASVVQQQPVLRVGILKQDTGKATFSHVTEVDLHNHVEWRNVDCESRVEYDAKLADTQGWLHDQLWPEIETRPPWRVLILRPKEGLYSEQIFHLFFSYHHSLADGTSGKEFHKHLLAALKTQIASPESTYLISCPDPPKLPEDQFEVIPFKNTYKFLLRTIWEMVVPSFLKPRKTPIWGGHKIDFSIPYVTRVLPVDFTPEMVESLVKASRNNSSTLTTAVHGMILASLSRRLSEEEISFVCSTPINLRPWMSPKADPELKTKFRVAITSLNVPHSSDVVLAFRASNTATDDLIWQTAKRLKDALNQRTSSMPVDDVSGLIPLISDFFEYWRNKDGDIRAETWEVSNIGVLDGDAGESGWKVTRGMFTNGAMVAGPAIGFNIVSVQGATLTISITWQQTVVEEKLIKEVADDLQALVERLHETGKFE